DAHVVGTGDVIGGLLALDLPHLLGDDGRFPDLRLNQDVRLNHLSLLCSRGSGECSRSAGTWYRELARCRELCSSRYQWSSWPTRTEVTNRSPSSYTVSTRSRWP